MFNITDSVNIWVSSKAPDGGTGTVELPFNTIDAAIEKAVPGTRIVLLPGTYEDKVSLREVQGSEMKPITITNLPDRKEPVICESEWFLYDVSDLIISGITFSKIENSALSIMGTSERNIIKNCHFDRCGESSECSLFLSGNSGRFNVIEECTFDTPDATNEKQIALFIAQSVDEEDLTLKPSSHSIIRYSTFKHYGVGVVVGSADDIEAYAHHLIEENYFDSCTEGVRLKAAGTVVKANIFKDSAKGISVVSGEGAEIVENRFDGCTLAISCGFHDVTIAQNCMINSTVTIMPEAQYPLPIVLHNNTMVSTTSQAPFLDINTDTVVAITDSVFDGVELKLSDSVTIINSVSSQQSDIEGISTQSLTYGNSAIGDFSLELEQGCSCDAAFTTSIAPVPQVTVGHTHNHDEDDTDIEVKGNLDERDMYLKSFFHDDEGIEEEENAPIFEAMSVGQKPLRPIGEDGELEDN